ncbi:MAG: hypothetical protein JSS36_05560 [Proteobacteria bacterium]|nr:hypothetical protein [Pseudomonadota bacterium]
MRGLMAVGLVWLTLAGCHQTSATADDSSTTGGRYHGVGIMDADRGWRHMNLANKPEDSTRARLADDDHVIVTMDNRTGELRQCGDRSGVCVSMNPWSHPAAASAPVPLADHFNEAADTASSDEPSGAASQSATVTIKTGKPGG